MNELIPTLPMTRPARHRQTADGEPFTHLVTRHKDRLFAYLLRFCGERSQAEDLLQETLVRAWRAFPRYDHRERFASWIFTIAHSVALDARRYEGVRRDTMSVAEPPERLAGEDPESIVLAQELAARINEFLDGLPPEQRHVFLLRQHSEMTFQEIARSTGEPLSTVLGRMHYAVAKLRKLLRESDDE